MWVRKIGQIGPLAAEPKDPGIVKMALDSSHYLGAK